MKQTAQTLSKALLLSGLLTAFSAPALADEAPTLTIENFIGTINWSQGDVLSVKILKNKDGVMTAEDGNDLLIDGGIDNPAEKNCRGYSGKFEISLGKSWSGRIGGYKNLKDFPKLEITVPSNAHVKIDNAIPFISGTPDIARLDAKTSGCGAIMLGNAAEYIHLASRGSGDLEAGDTPEAIIKLIGSGDVTLGDVGAFDFALRGSGDVNAATLGSGEMSLRGSGDIDTGDVSGDILISSSGSGDISLGNVAGDLAYKGSGSGDFDADSANGRLSIENRGSGNSEIDDGNVSELIISASGSSNVDFDGTAGNANLRASGSSDIYVARVTGTVTESDSGAADIKIKRRE